jgi:hypothetical protein
MYAVMYPGKSSGSLPFVYLAASSSSSFYSFTSSFRTRRVPEPARLCCCRAGSRIVIPLSLPRLRFGGGVVYSFTSRFGTV